MATTEVTSLDQKAMLLYEQYGDNEYVALTMKDLETSRNRALNLGIFSTVALFAGNEFARLTLRSPLFKLKI